MKIAYTASSEIVRTPRVKQLEGMFDVPASEKITRDWQGVLPIEERPWNVGLIVGPSGAGKTTIMRQAFGGDMPELTWGASSVVDDFAATLKIAEIAEVCSAVGFNTIPSWMKPHAVLSNGEKFRVDLARRMLELPDPVVVDEFTSVVDRQVAKIGAHAVQKFVRRHNRRFVAVTCHYDVIEWLQPDWVLEPADMTFAWRSPSRRPALDVAVRRVPYELWRIFAPFHYLTAELHRTARCFCLYVDGTVASFAGVMHRPHPKVDNIKGVSRLVTLPDFQGLGTAMALVDTLGSAYKALDLRLHTYPAHPALIRTFDRSQRWALRQKPGTISQRTKGKRDGAGCQFGGRPNAVFEYCGPALEDRTEAARLIG
jgi:GNAT superfamily N-acetyltransferase